MIWKCKCGATKTSQPYRSSIVKEMMCDACAGPGRKTPRLVNQRPSLKQIMAVSRTQVSVTSRRKG